MRDAGVEVNRVARLQGGLVFAVMERQFAIQHIEEFISRMHMSLGFGWLRQGYKLRKVGIHVPVWHHVAQAYEEVGRRFHPGLRQTHTLLTTVNAEHSLRLRIEKVREILRKNHRNACQVAQSRHHAARFQLREEAGAESCMTA